jgi:MFS family permease
VDVCIPAPDSAHASRADLSGFQPERARGLYWKAPVMTEAADQRLFTPRFFTMCGFTFTVFLSAFQLLPTAPFRILDLGGSTVAAGAFVGFLTYASALSAPLTGALADHLGRRPQLIACSLVLAGIAVAYGLVESYRVLLGLVLVQGVFWSGLLAASSAYMTDFIPEARRAEGIGYWGMSTMLAVMVAPYAGFSVYKHGWWVLASEVAALNLLMAFIAWRLPRDVRAASPLSRPRRLSQLVEWRVVVVSLSLFVCSFGYGGITSFVALYAEGMGIGGGKGLYFLVFAVVVLLTRPFTGRWADRIGHRRFLVPCFVLVCAAFVLLALARGRPLFVASAVVFGLGFGNVYPALAAHVVRHVDPMRRGAALGGILAALDTGIGTGSIATGVLIDRFGFGVAFGCAALLSAAAAPLYLYAEPRLLSGRSARLQPDPRPAQSHAAPRTPEASP